MNETHTAESGWMLQHTLAHTVSTPPTCSPPCDGEASFLQDTDSAHARFCWLMVVQLCWAWVRLVLYLGCPAKEAANVLVSHGLA